MRDKNFNSIQFTESLEGFFASVPDRCLELRMQVVDNPNFLSGEYKIIGLPEKRNALIGLSIASWYTPEEVRWLLQMEIEEKVKHLSLEDRIIFDIILSSKAEMILFLQETNLWHTRSFFGNIAGQGKKILPGIKLIKVNKKVVRPQRKRGYHDHGTLVPNHNWTPKSDISLTRMQNEIEEKRNIFSQMSNFIRGLLE